MKRKKRVLQESALLHSHLQEMTVAFLRIDPLFPRLIAFGKVVKLFRRGNPCLVVGSNGQQMLIVGSFWMFAPRNPSKAFLLDILSGRIASSQRGVEANVGQVGKTMQSNFPQIRNEGHLSRTSWARACFTFCFSSQ